jgi:hypothetical protein
LLGIIKIKIIINRMYALSVPRILQGKGVGEDTILTYTQVLQPSFGTLTT